MSYNVAAYIPARKGSVRVPVKNLRMLAGKPLLHYVLETVAKVGNLDKAYLNTESDEIASAAENLCDVYVRSPELAISSTKTDEILYDFAKNIDCKSIAVINPTAPFVTSQTIESAIDLHLSRGRDTVFTTTAHKKHLIYDGQPVNFPLNQLSPRTQELQEFQYINFITFIIETQRVISNYEKKGYCLYEAPIHFFPMTGIECHDIDDEDDFLMAEALIFKNSSASAEYHPSVHDAVRSGTDFSN